MIGIHMTNWDPQDESEQPFSCPQSKDLADARNLCEKLDIELHQVNFVKEYWNSVFSNFLKDYKNGRTVVPDIGCNKHIKFGLLRQHAFEKLGADALATGHFAKTSQEDFLLGTGPQKHDEKVKLLRAKDPLKDQTFFLSYLSSEQLRGVIFPVGSMYKTEVRAMAATEPALQMVANKVESMGICFIGKKRKFGAFLNKYIDDADGPFVDIGTGQPITGLRHRGIHNFTIGKRVRREQCLTAIDRDKPELLAVGGDPYYVADIEPATQTVYLCCGSVHPKLYAKRISISAPSWISGQWPADQAQRLKCLLQRTTSPISCSIQRPEDNQSGLLELEFRFPLRAAAPGQTLAFYDGDECLGCAQIERVIETL